MMDEPGFAWRDATVAIVGLGLIGGSFALALREKHVCRKIIAVDRDPETRARAAATGIETAAALDAIAPADLIVLATPARAIIELLPRVGAQARAGAIVFDLGSTKREIARAMRTLPAPVQCLGGHPMCGKETAGFAAADANLFRNAVFALTPLERTAPQTVARIAALVETFGARPLVLDAERHDHIVAAISHLPYTVAAALMLVAAERAHTDDLTFALAASGFRDTSRLAASNVAMMLDILLTNREHIAALMRAHAQAENHLADLLARGDEDALRATLERAAEQRRALFQNQKS